MISQKFSVPIQKIVGCKIDLRESFMLLTDMHFGISSNVKYNIENLIGLLISWIKQKLTLWMKNISIWISKI